MSPAGPELADFLEVVGKVASSVAESSESLRDAQGLLDSSGLLALGRDTAGEDDALTWLAHTVRVAAESSPSLAYVLASRYAAQRALGADANADHPVFALAATASHAVVPTAVEPDAVVVLDLASSTLRMAPWSAVSGSATLQERTGLRASGLRAVEVPDTEAIPDGETALGAWDVLTGAALAGLARRAVRWSSDYVMERRQFGAPIGSFMGMRALVADMALKVDALEAVLSTALSTGAHAERVSACAGRTAVEVCIDAIQSHGGYGYIDEYPLAGFLRDAISLQARAGGRRFHIARKADAELGPRGGSL